MNILAHRCYRDGPDPQLENSVGAFRHCLEDGMSAEIDIRRWENGTFYISHDPRPFDAKFDAAPYFEALAESDVAPIALNVKELGQEEATLCFLNRFHVINQLFFFDMELIEETPGRTAQTLRKYAPDARIAARVSDRNEPVERALSIKPANVIWLDEFDSLWVTDDAISRLKKAGKSIYAISPEIHGFDMDRMIERWRRFVEWEIDGICTDYPNRLAEFLNAEGIRWRP